MNKSEKKVLLVIIWHMGIGGMQKRMKDIFLEMQKKKYSNWQIYLLVKHNKKSYLSDEITKKTNVKIEYFSKYHWWSNSIFSVFWLIKKYIEIKPSVTLTFLDHLSVLIIWIKIFLRSKTKIILNESMLTSKYVNMSRGIFAGFWKYLIKISYKKANLIIVPTIACKNDLTKNFEVPGKLITVIPNWTMFKPEKSNNFIYDLIFIGRIESEKGIKLLLKLLVDFKRHNLNLKMAVVGDGNMKRWFINQINKIGLEKNIEFLGYLGEIKRVLLKSKILILPTLNEGLPNVILEAGMCSVPTITNRFDGVEDLIKNGENGYITNNISNMSLKVRKLLKNEHKRKKMGERMQELVIKKFSKKQQKKFISCLID